MSCIFCVHFDRTLEPNCGHVLLNAVHLPAHYVTGPFMENVEMGHRAANYLSSENTGSRFLRKDHIERQAHYAAVGGWK